MKKYEVRKLCSWRTFTATPHADDHPDGPKVIDESALATRDGKALPPEVVAHFVGRGTIVPLEEEVPTESAKE